MAVWSRINLKEIEYTRIDAEFYQPKYIQELYNWKKLEKVYPVLKLKQVICKPVRTGHTPKNRSIKQDDILIPFIKTNTLREGNIEYSKVEYLPKRCLISSDYIEDEATIVTIIGATKEIVGRVAIREIKDPASTTNQNVAIINFKKEIDPYFAMIYLQSKFGRDQLWRHSRQTEQVNLNCREVERVLFPNILKNEQSTIGNLVRKSFRLQEQSQNLYKQATDLLEHELGLDKITFEKPKSYLAKFSNVVTTIRLDSNHFQPKFEQLKNHLEGNFETSKIGYLVSCNRRGLQPNYSSNGEVDVINSKHITQTHLKYSEFAKTNLEDYKDSMVAQIQEGDILIYTTGAYVGQTNVYLSNKQALASNHVNILRLKNSNIDSTYVALVLNTTIGKLQTEQHIRGSAQAELYPNDIAKFIIPILNIDKMKKIGDLVRISLKSSQQSQQLLADAKAIVEQLIEEAANK